MLEASMKRPPIRRNPTYAFIQSNDLAVNLGLLVWTRLGARVRVAPKIAFQLPFDNIWKTVRS